MEKKKPMPKKTRFFAGLALPQASSFERIYGKITRNVNPYPPDEHIVRWLRAQAPRLAQRDEGDKSALPASSPFSVAQSLYLKLLNLSGLDTAMTTGAIQLTGLFPSSSPRPSRSFRLTRSVASSFSSVQP